MTSPSSTWYERVPKAELHLHLEGAIPLPALWSLVQKYGGGGLANIEALRRRFAYRDFPHFIETWVWKNQFLCEYEDFTFIAQAVATHLASQNIRYAEVFYSPADFRKKGLLPQEITYAIRLGLERVPAVAVQLIPDLVRDLGPAVALTTLQQLAEVKDQGLVGVGLGGSEQDHPPELFAEAYQMARRLGFHTTAHAGEAAGAASIWGALQVLQAERIGHGTRAGEDPRLVDYLAEQQTPLEMCPLSNLRTNVISCIQAHPIRSFFQRGLLVTVNTDDPQMFNNSLAEEYRLLETELGFSRSEVQQLILNALRAAWLPPDGKEALMAAFQSDPSWNERR